MIKTNPQVFYTVLCGLVVLIVMINIWLFSALHNKKRGGSQAWNLFRNATRQVKQPWKNEDDQLEELSNLVAGLRQEGSHPRDPKDPPKVE